MKLRLVLVLTLLTLGSAHALPIQWSFEDVCRSHPPSPAEGPLTAFTLHRLEDQDLIVVDRGFCGLWNESRVVGTPEKPFLAGYRIRVYMAHSFTRYFDSDVEFRSSRYSVDIRDYSWAERGSREYFLPSTWLRDGNNPLQIFDEPSNIFTVSIEKDGNEFFLSAFHPKFLQAPDQVKYMQGTIDGVPVNQVQPVNEPVSGTAPRPGQSTLQRNEFTYGQMNYELGYGKRIPLLRGKAGDITYVPRVGVGVMVGVNTSVMLDANHWWESNVATSRLQYQGLGGSVGNRLEINFKNERVGVFYENRLGMYDVTSRFFDGTEHFKLVFLSNSFGLKLRIYPLKKRTE